MRLNNTSNRGMQAIYLAQKSSSPSTNNPVSGQFRPVQDFYARRTNKTKRSKQPEILNYLISFYTPVRYLLVIMLLDVPSKRRRRTMTWPLARVEPCEIEREGGVHNGQILKHGGEVIVVLFDLMLLCCCVASWLVRTWSAHFRGKVVIWHIFKMNCFF